MIDIQLLREFDSKIFDSFDKRFFELNYIFFYNFDFKIRKIKTRLYTLRYKYKFISFFIKNLKDNNLKDSFLLIENFFLKKIMCIQKFKLKYLEHKFKMYLLLIPNVLDSSVCLGKYDYNNLEIRCFFRSYKFNIFEIKLLKDLESCEKYLDFSLASKITGSGFVILKDFLASLHRALSNYMLDLHVFKHGYMEVCSPLLVNTQSMFNSGHLPKFYNDQFNISGTNFWLIPTAEVVLSNMLLNMNVKNLKLPLQFVSKTACFRKERGSYGYKVKGLIRQHQFDKVELLNIVSPNESYNNLEQLVWHAETVLQNLNLSYRVLSLCSGDIGFTASKTYDLEVWFPKRKMYIEVSSCSNTESFQSYRMGYKIKNKSSFYYPHILNGSGLAVGRILLALIENYSDSTGRFFIPDILVKYMNGVKFVDF